MRIVLVILVIVGIAGTLLTQRELLRLQREKPELLGSVGIIKIDWWWGCLRGIFRLGFSSAGESLPASSRWAFRLVMFTYAWLIALSLLVATGHVPRNL